MTSSKILFYIKDPNGGTGRFLENLILELEKKNIYQIYSISHIEKNKAFNYRNKTVGVKITKQSSISLLKIIAVIWNIFGVYRQILIYKPDIIYTLDIYANLTVIILKPLLRNIYIINSTHVNLTAHIDNGRTNLFSGFLKLLVRSFYKYADIHIVPSFGLKEQLIKSYYIPVNKIVPIPYLINPKIIFLKAKERIFDEMLENSLQNKNTLKIFSMGRFEQQKDFEALINYISSIKSLDKKYHKKLQFFILGSGSLTPRLKKQAKKLNINEDIVFLGWQNNPYKFLRFADLLIHLSKFEGFGYSLIEAMTLGIPVISSDIEYGPSEILGKGKYGILLKVNNSSEILLNLNMLINDSNKRKYYSRLSKMRSSVYYSNRLLPKYSKLFNIAIDRPKTK